MAKAATATRVRKPAAAEPEPEPAVEIELLEIETNDALAAMPTKFASCYGAYHPFNRRSTEFVQTAGGQLRQVILYLRCPRCGMKATDTLNVERTPAGAHVLRRADNRTYEPPEGYGIHGQGRIDHDVLVTNRLLAQNPDVAAFFRRPI